MRSLISVTRIRIVQRYSESRRSPLADSITKQHCCNHHARVVHQAINEGTIMKFKPNLHQYYPIFACTHSLYCFAELSFALQVVNPRRELRSAGTRN